MTPAGAFGAAPLRAMPGAPLCDSVARVASPRPTGAVRSASRPRTPEWLPRTSPLGAGLPERIPSLRLKLPLSDEWLGLLIALLRLLEAERLELLDELRLKLLLEERLGLLDELRLILLLDERLGLLKLLEERLLLTELLLRLTLPPPLRLPPLRCANAGVALSARAIITNVNAFEVFIMLLLSYYCFFIFAT